MVYTRGSSDEFDRFAKVTGDSGWSWNELQPYIMKSESFGPPADNHNTTGQFNPSVHGFKGPLHVALPGFPLGTDSMVIETTRELPEFPYNIDMNSGDTIGMGTPPAAFLNFALVIDCYQGGSKPLLVAVNAAAPLQHT
jgi:choline dehydrogenase-like flavoprotein